MTIRWPKTCSIESLRLINLDKIGAPKRWVSDITYIATGQGGLYLTGTPERAILDLADRKVVGWAMSDTLKAVDTTVAAWRMALRNRPIDDHLLFHRSGDPVGPGSPICLHGI